MAEKTKQQLDAEAAAAAKKTKDDQLLRASKVGTNALRAISRLGSLKGMDAAHISKLESAVSDQTSKAFNRLRNPKAPAALEFDLTK